MEEVWKYHYQIHIIGLGLYEARSIFVPWYSTFKSALDANRNTEESFSICTASAVAWSLPISIRSDAWIQSEWQASLRVSCLD